MKATQLHSHVPGLAIATRSLARGLASTLALFALTACATRPSSEPLRYPALPPAKSESTVSAFHPASSLVGSSLSCRDAELPLPNALDDDCNGRVDDAPHDDPLLLVLAYPQAAAIGIFVRDANNNEQPLAGDGCSEASAYCTIQLPTGKLARGRHTLLARRTQTGTAAPPASVVVSIQSREKVTTYLARLEADSEELVLGELALP